MCGSHLNCPALLQQSEQANCIIVFTSFSAGHFINSIIGQVVSKIRQAFSEVVGYILLDSVQLCLVLDDLLKIL